MRFKLIITWTMFGLGIVNYIPGIIQGRNKHAVLLFINLIVHIYYEKQQKYSVQFLHPVTSPFFVFNMLKLNTTT